MKIQSSRAETSTLVAIASGAALNEVHGALDTLVLTSGVRPIVVTFGAHTEPIRTMRNRTAVFEGLVPRYLNNAVASLRLSSLPAVAWWREPSTEGLLELGDLVDRLVLDVQDPLPVWPLVPQLATRTAVSDLRWARLTRWRDLFAQFFDLSEVRNNAESFSQLTITASDRHAARLLAGWIVSRLPGGERLRVSVQADTGIPVIRSLELTGDEITLSLRLLQNDVCIETSVTARGTAPTSRVVAAGEGGLAELMGEELRVRSRDIAFEDAIAAAGGIK